jgi:hypothetical protein
LSKRGACCIATDRGTTSIEMQRMVEKRPFRGIASFEIVYVD